MLDTYKNLFSELNQNGVRYAIYKGAEHLEEDLKGDRGDIDIFIATEDLNEINRTCLKYCLFKDNKSNRPIYFIGLDLKTHKTVLLDVVDKIYVGSKGIFPHSKSVTIDFKQLSQEGEIYTTKTLDQIYTSLVINTLKCPQDKNIEALIDLHHNNKDAKTDMWKEFPESLCTRIIGGLIKERTWRSVHRTYKKEILKHFKTNIFLLSISKLELVRRISDAFSRRIMQVPRYRIRKRGYLAAFVGVDGAGKSSSIESISQLDFFKKTGIKSIYFGNNNYWIPFLNKALIKYEKTPILKQLLFILSQFDKQMRVFYALFLMHNGNIVMADRYFYDQNIYEKYLQPNKRNVLKRLVWALIKPKMIRSPDLTIFLDVSSEVSYNRKQDYSYDKLIQVNKAYKTFMRKVEGVSVVNADQNFLDVQQEILEIFIKHEKNIK